MSKATLIGVRKSRNIKNLYNLTINFAERDLKTRFKGSILGWLWSLIYPLATLAIYSIVFSIIFRATPPDMGYGRQGIYAIWLFCGLVMWNFLQASINSGIGALMGTGQLLQKVYFPAYIPVLGSTVAAGIQSLIELGLLLIVLAFLGNVSVTWLLVIPWLVIFVGFCTCLSIVIGVMNIYYRDLAHLVNIFIQILFYMTPVIYPFSLVPQYWSSIPLASIFKANPMAQFVEILRSLIYELNSNSLKSWLYITIWALFAWFIAWLTLRYKGADLGENV